jgi:hypothetical protein
VEGVTEGARTLLKSPNGARIEQAVKGLVLSLDGAGGANELGTVSLSTNSKGFALNTLLNVADGSRGAKLRVPEAADPVVGAQVASAIRSDGRMWMLRLGGANAEQGRLAIGHDASKSLLSAVNDAAAGKTGILARRKGDAITYLLRHEGEHAISSTLALERRMLRFEEAVADTLARWPGTVAQTAKSIGIAHSKPSRLDWVRQPFKGYVDYAGNMRSVLELAGVNTFDVKSRPLAANLLQATRAEAGVARALATEIVARHGQRAGTVEQVTERVIDAAIDRPALRKLAKDLGQPDALRAMQQTRRDTVIGMALDPLGAVALLGTAGRGYLQFGDNRDRIADGGSPLDGSLALDAGIVGGAVLGARMGGIRLALPIGLLAAGALGGTAVGLTERTLRPPSS